MTVSQEAAVVAEPSSSAASGKAREAARYFSEYGILVLFIVLFVFLSIASDPFLSKENLLNILEQNAAIGIIAVGGTLILIAGGFDLSVGAIFALASVLAAKSAGTVSPALALAAGAMAGMLVGTLNGMLMTVAKVNPIIGTLASGMMIRGVAALWTAGFVIDVQDPSFLTLGTDGAFGVKYAIWAFLLWSLACGFLLQRTVFGRHIYASGGNPDAARLAGVRVGRVQTAAFALSGLGAGLAGIIISSRIGTGQADLGAGIELTAIAAIVIGGTSIGGGVGTIWRTVVGVLFLALVLNGLNLLDIDPIYQQIVQGAIILLAVALDAQGRRRLA